MSSAASKRKKETDDDDSLSASAKKQRTRVSFSCGECHRRKQKCDRQTPCSHCLARKVPELCKPYTPGKAEQDISARLLRVERILEVALPQYFNGRASTPSNSYQNGSTSRQRSPSNEEDSSSQYEDQDPTGGSFQSGKWFGASASGSIAPASFLEQLQHAVPEYEHCGKTNGIRPVAPNGAGLESEPSAADNLKSLVQECGVSPHKISELLQELPPQRVSDALVDYYFDAINWTRYPLVEKEFRESYASICANTQSGIGAANPGNVRFLPLLFVVLAISVRLSPESIGGDARIRRVTSLRYYWSSRRSLLIAAAVQPDSIDVVLTRLLSARFLTFDRRITECWSQLGAAVRTAQALGMHRDGSTMNMDPVQTENRRRIWSYLYHADRSYALALGRPHVIIDDYTSTHPPLNIEDPNILLGPAPHQIPPLTSPTPMTFVILRHTLASIIGRMVHHFQKVRPSSHYSEVINIDDELLRFMKSLPPHYAMEPDRSLDEELPCIPIHRFLLITEIAFVRISLHRPYLLRRLGSEKYTRSRKACFESALMDYHVRQAFKETVPKETRETLGNAYRVFQSAMISGIYLILEPRGKDGEAMHAILDAFMQDHEGVREMDETTRRELRTIEFLKQKASQIEGNPPPLSSSNKRRRTAPTSKASGNSPSSENPAHLLLGLQYPSPKPQLVPSSAPSPTLSNMTPAQYPSPTAQLTRSPTFQRIYNPTDNHALSPLASGSPGVEDDPAQLMLDRWCNSVSQVPSMSTGASAPPMSWAGEMDFGWSSSNSPFPPGMPALLNGLENPDWAHWDQLVNTIQHPS